MRITVTEEDIKTGNKHSSMSCPVALAISRQIPGLWASVGQNKMVLYQTGKLKSRAYLYNLSKATTKFIRRFDAGFPVEPFTFIAKEVK